jgi:phosphatidate cytidylyltransferase
LRYQREITAGVLIPAVLVLLVRGPAWAFALLVALGASVALWEFQSMMAGAGWKVPAVASLGLFLAGVAAAQLASAPGLVAVTAAALLLLPTLVLFGRAPEPVLLVSSAGSVFATLYVGAGAAAMVGLRAIGWKPVLFLLVVVWSGDSAAYYVGRRWGKRRLAPVVSPKKTWEGFWGQICGGALAGAIVAIATILTATTAATATSAATATTAPAGSSGFEGFAVVALGGALGALLSAAAVTGDLVESTFKRSLSVKDSGGLLPGHGGLLDRLDSLLYTAPLAWAAFRYLPGGLPR